MALVHVFPAMTWLIALNAMNQLASALNALVPQMLPLLVCVVLVVMVTSLMVSPAIVFLVLLAQEVLLAPLAKFQLEHALLVLLEAILILPMSVNPALMVSSALQEPLARLARKVMVLNKVSNALPPPQDIALFVKMGLFQSMVNA